MRTEPNKELNIRINEIIIFKNSNYVSNKYELSYLFKQDTNLRKIIINKYKKEDLVYCFTSKKIKHNNIYSKQNLFLIGYLKDIFLIDENCDSYNLYEICKKYNRKISTNELNTIDSARILYHKINNNDFKKICEKENYVPSPINYHNTSSDCFSKK